MAHCARNKPGVDVLRRSFEYDGNIEYIVAIEVDVAPDLYRENLDVLEVRFQGLLHHFLDVFEPYGFFVHGVQLSLRVTGI